MKENEIEVEGFYLKCAELLGAEHTYKKFPYRKRTRWNNRGAGNGRFIGHGLIRVYSENLIRVNLYNPVLNGTFKSPEEALIALSNVIFPLCGE